MHRGTVRNMQSFIPKINLIISASSWFYYKNIQGDSLARGPKLLSNAEHRQMQVTGRVQYIAEGPCCFPLLPVCVYKFSSHYLNNIIFYRQQFGASSKRITCITMYGHLNVKRVLYRLFIYFGSILFIYFGSILFIYFDSITTLYRLMGCHGQVVSISATYCKDYMFQQLYGDILENK